MKSLRNDERGIVSIVVTVVFILLMSMIVLAMSQNSNREQRQALDRQLSDQAFYNAESGIADWANHLYENPNVPVVKSDCETDSSFGANAPQGSVDNDVNSYSCVTYDRAPNSIEINPLNADKAKVFRIRPQGTGATDTITRLNLNWTSPSGTNVIGGCPLPTVSTPPATISSGSCNLTGIRFELFEVKNTRDELINGNFVGYLLPSNSGAAATIGYSPGQQGFVRSAGCTTAGGCSVSITGGLAISNASQFYLVIKSLYTPNKLSITAQSATGSQLDLVDAQVMIDSTGRANDVLRRVQVRLPAQRVDYQAGTGGSDVLATKESICKLLDVSDVDRTATFAPGC